MLTAECWRARGTFCAARMRNVSAATGMFAAICALIGITFPVATATAGVNIFTPIGPAGGLMYDVAFHPTDPAIAYAAGESGFYRSTDGGMSWQLVQGGIHPRVIAVHPIAPSRVLLLTIDSTAAFLHSDDSGATLSAMSNFPFEASWQTQIAYSRNGGALYVANGDRVYRSINQGFAWEARGTVPISDSIHTLAVDPDNALQLYVTVGDEPGGYQSADAGATWMPWWVPGNPKADFAIADSQPRRIWVASAGLAYSDDAGTNWTYGEPASFVVAVDPGSSSTVYSAAPHILRRSTNNGSQWTDVPGTARIGTISAIAFQPQNPRHMLISGSGGLMGSLDGGANWTIRNEGINAVSVSHLVASLPSDRIYANTDYSGVYAISGDSQSLEALNNEAIRDLDTERATILSQSLAVLPGTQDRLFVGLPSGLARSVDGGEVWSLSSHPDFDTAQVIKVASISSNDEILLAVTRDGAYRSTDGGDNWVSAPAVADAEFLTPHLAVAPSNPAVIYLVGLVATPGGIAEPTLYKSIDSAEHWARMPAPSTDIAAVAVDPRTEDVLYVLDRMRVFRSTDGGQTWSANANASDLRALSSTIAIDPQNPDVLFVAGNEHVFRSVDAGQYWQAVPLGDASHVRALAVDPLRPHTLYAGLQAHGVREISVQPDLSISVDVPTTPLSYGIAATYTYAVQNKGPFDATGVRTSIRVPDDAVQIAASTSSGTCSRTANIVICLTPILRHGTSVEISLTFAQPAPGQFPILASVSGDQPDPVTGNNILTSSISVAEVSDLAVRVQSAAQVVQGSGITYTVEIGNSGPNDATNVTATFQLASGLDFSSGIASVGTCASVANTMTCALPAVAKDSTATLTISTLPASTVGSFISTGTVTAGGTDSQTGNNAATATTTVVAPPPPPPSGGGASGAGGSGGGGGAISPWMLAALLLLSLFQSACLRSRYRSFHVA
jgi:uncharacterized repeat protein (TIGR01451 family)